MNKYDIRSAFDKIDPDYQTKQKMLNKILNHQKGKRLVEIMKGFNLRRVIPAVALVLVIVGGVALHGALHNNESIIPGDGAERGGSTEDEFAALPITNQFRIDNRHYIIMQDESKDEFNFTHEIKDSEIGDEIAVIRDTPDKNLLDTKVYTYLPAGGEAIVAVWQDNEFKLYKFLSFESYNNNQDEDAIKYLELYGIKEAADIAKVQFVSYSKQSTPYNKPDINSEITVQNEIEAFYNYYSAMKNSSDKYFDKLFSYDNESIEKQSKKYEDSNGVQSNYNTKNADEPFEIGIDIYVPDYIDKDRVVHDDSMPNDEYFIDRDRGTSDSFDASTDMIDMGDNTNAGSTTPNAGSAGNALANQITIRIYNKNGIYLDAVYYIDLGFISRHEVNGEFAGFLDNYIK